MNEVIHHKGFGKAWLERTLKGTDFTNGWRSVNDLL
jgi:hypothetical protein